MNTRGTSMIRTLWAFCALACVAALDHGRARADETSAIEARAHSGAIIGAKVGAGVGKPWSEFGATPVFELELGYVLPPLHRSVGVFLSGQYVQPGIDGVTSPADARLPGSGLASYQITQQQLVLSLGGMYRFDVGSRLIMPYAGLGGRLYMLRTNTTGKVDGQSFGENHETQSRVGLLLLGGAEFYLGPGAVLAEVSFSWPKLNGYVLRDTNLGTWALSLGYRLML
jgi:hypothetical protein